MIEGCVMTVSSDVRGRPVTDTLERPVRNMLRHHGREVPMHQVACLKQRATDVLQLAGVVFFPRVSEQMNSVLELFAEMSEAERAAFRAAVGRVEK